MGWGSSQVGLWGLEWRTLRKLMVITLKHQPLETPKVPDENFGVWRKVKECSEDLYFEGVGWGHRATED